MQPAEKIAASLIAVALMSAVAFEAHAQAARVSLTVEDAAGKPIAGTTVTITCWAKESYKVVKTTNKKGKATVTHRDSQQTYTYQVAKEGFQTQVIQIRPSFTETARPKVVLRPVDQAELTQAKKARAAERGRAVSVFEKGTEARERGDLELAEHSFRQAAELSPDAAEPHIALAAVAHERGDFAAAASAAEAALARSPNNEQALLLRYDAYRLLGDIDSTASAAAALREHGTAASAAAGTLFAEGMKEYRADHVETAVQKFEDALDLDPKAVNAYLMLGNIAATEGDVDRALAMAAKALDLDPSNSNALRIRYDALLQSGDAETTREALDALIAADSEWASTELFNHAVELYNSDQMAGAAAAFERIVRLRPDDAKALYLLGMAEFNLGRAKEAVAHLKQFLELEPDSPDASIAKEMLKYAEE